MPQPMRHITGLLRRAGRCTAGAAVLEFAMGVGAFLLVVLAIVDIGRVLYADHSLNNATRTVARIAAVRGATSGAPLTDSEIETLVKEEALFLDPDEITVTTTYDPDNQPGSTVTLDATYAFSFLALPLPTRDLTLMSTASTTIAR